MFFPFGRLKPGPWMSGLQNDQENHVLDSRQAKIALRHGNSRASTLRVNERIFVHSFRIISCKTELFLNNISLLSFADLNFTILVLIESITEA